MKAKALEVRDRATFIPVLAVDMNPGAPYPDNGSGSEEWLDEQLAAHGARLYLLRRVGYPCNGEPNIVVTALDASGGPAWSDPYGWGGRTYPVAHNYIIEHWDELRDGDVVDVEFILGESSKPKISERLDSIKAA